MLPPWIAIEPIIRGWLQEDIGRGDRATQSLFGGTERLGRADWIANESGIIAGLPIAARVFELLSDHIRWQARLAEGQACEPGQCVAHLEGPLDALLLGERVALNAAMHLSGIATATWQYADRIADLPAQLVDTRKTTPGMRLLEKYATQVGGATNHRLGLDDAAMLKDNHIRAAGSIEAAIARIRAALPYLQPIAVEADSLAAAQAALAGGADAILLDNLPLEQMREAARAIGEQSRPVKIEASGNITQDTIRSVAEAGAHYISTSAPITQSAWLDLSMQLHPS